MIEVEKPHCGLTARRSNGMNRLASRIRASSAETGSSWDVFVVTSPNTAILSSGISAKGSNEPERSSSYSSKRRWARIPRKMGLETSS